MFFPKDMVWWLKIKVQGMEYLSELLVMEALKVSKVTQARATDLGHPSQLHDETLFANNTIQFVYRT